LQYEIRSPRVGLAGLATLAATVAASAQQPAAPAPATIKIGIVTFLTGPAAARSEFPDATRPKSWSKTSTPARCRRPTSQAGFGGAKLEIKYVDEAARPPSR